MKALKTLEDYVGHSYTLGKMDFIAIDDFLMGAMVSETIQYFSNLLKTSGKLFIKILCRKIGVSFPLSKVDIITFSLE